jgi:antirestriction protein ArdC
MDSPSAFPGIDVYSIVTNRIMDLLTQGTIPWQQPWNVDVPANVISKRPYRGINLWLLLSLPYARHFYLTWAQLKQIGGSVKQGEHGHVVIFWKTIENSDNGEAAKTTKPIPILRYYKVFNIEQCTEIPESLIVPVPEKPVVSIEACDAVSKAMPACPDILHRVQQAFYDPNKDYINMPRKKSFVSSEAYYATLFHELVHSTGHSKRLSRSTLMQMAEYGSDPYSIEELVAELGSAYLCGMTGILPTQLENASAYIQGWLNVLKNDKRFVVIASGLAQRAVDYIVNRSAESHTTDSHTDDSPF